MTVRDCRGEPLRVNDYVVRLYDDGSYAEAIVIALGNGQPGRPGSCGILIARDGSCEERVPADQIEFVHRPDVAPN
jgi:hypothetical protein